MIFTPEDTLKNEEEEAEEDVSLFFSLFFPSPFFLRLFCPSLHNNNTTKKKKKN